jgi:hypothetical protein
MRFRNLRIAWSVVCGLACVLLVVLSVRSNYRIDQIILPVNQSAYIGFGSVPNAFMVGLTNVRPTETWGSGPAAEWLANLDDEDLPWSAAPKFRIIDGCIMLPYWFVTLLSAAFGIAPWIRLPTRFSLRTMLIATTLIAVVLGLIVWLR